RGVEGPDRDRLLAHHFVPGVQEEHQEVLALLLAELRTDERGDIIGSADLSRLPAAVLPFRQLADIHDLLQNRGEKEEGAPADESQEPRMEVKRAKGSKERRKKVRLGDRRPGIRTRSWPPIACAD